MSGVIQENKQWHRTRHTLLSTRTFLTLYLRIHIYLEREQVSPNYNLFQLCVQKIERVEFYVRKMFRSLLNRFLEYGYTYKITNTEDASLNTMQLKKFRYQVFIECYLSNNNSNVNNCTYIMYLYVYLTFQLLCGTQYLLFTK